MFKDGYTMMNVAEKCADELKKTNRKGMCSPLQDENGIYIGMKLETEQKGMILTETTTEENKILLEITEFCKYCSSNLCCPEDECVLFRIEQIVVKNNKKKKRR